METSPIFANLKADPYGRAASDQRSGDFFLALLNERSARHDQSAAPERDGPRPDPYRNKIDPDKDEFRAERADDDDIDKLWQETRREANARDDERESYQADEAGDSRPRDGRDARANDVGHDDTTGQTDAAKDAPDRAAQTEADSAAQDTSEAATSSRDADTAATQTAPQAGPASADSNVNTAANGGAQNADPAAGSIANSAAAQASATGPAADHAIAGAAPNETAQTATQGPAGNPAGATDPAVLAANAASTGQMSAPAGNRPSGASGPTPGADSAHMAPVATHLAKQANTMAQAGSGSGTGAQGEERHAAPNLPARAAQVAQNGAGNAPAGLSGAAQGTPEGQASGQGIAAARFDLALTNAGKTAAPTTPSEAQAQAPLGSPAGQSAQMAARATGPVPGQPATPAGQPVPVGDVAVHIQRAAAKGEERISIRLHPAELGHVQVSLKTGADGITRAAVQVERPETLDMLQRDARGLERALQDAGLKTDSNSLSFTLRDHAQGEAKEHGGQAANADGANKETDGQQQNEEAEAPIQPALSSDRALDIHV